MKYFFILLLLCATKSIAQNIPDQILLDSSVAKPSFDEKEYFRLFVIKSMINAINFDKLVEAPKGFAQLASIIVIFNKNGAVDSAIVTTKLNQYFELKKSPITELRTFKPILEYANCTVILPILYIRMNEVDINLKNGFLEQLIGLIPPNFLNKKKNLILLKSEINPFSQIK